MYWEMLASAQLLRVRGKEMAWSSSHDDSTGARQRPETASQAAWPVGITKCAGG
jgi:hypothetical protein